MKDWYILSRFLLPSATMFARLSKRRARPAQFLAPTVLLWSIPSAAMPTISSRFLRTRALTIFIHLLLARLLPGRVRSLERRVGAIMHIDEIIRKAEQAPRADNEV